MQALLAKVLEEAPVSAVAPGVVREAAEVKPGEPQMQALGMLRGAAGVEPGESQMQALGMVRGVFLAKTTEMERALELVVKRVELKRDLPNPGSAEMAISVSPALSWVEESSFCSTVCGSPLKSRA